MRETQHQTETLRDQACRRRALRTPVPVEILFTIAGQKVPASVRNASVDETAHTGAIGIGIHHHDVLPLDTPLNCRTNSESKTLPEESDVTLVWTRHFGSSGYLSGGRMIRRPDESTEQADLSRHS